MADRLSLRVLTPEREVLSAEVDRATLTASEGEVGILPGHAPLLAELRAGEASFRDGAKTRHFALSDGFLEVSNDAVTALVRTAEAADDIDTVRAERRRAERESQLADAKLEEREQLQAEISLRKQVVRLKVARRSQGA